MSEILEEIKVVPPRPGSCPVCATMHKPKEPHDRDSLYYQNWFRKRYRRFPNWEDAMAHCDDNTKEKFIRQLSRRGIYLEKHNQKEE
mgnify:CR=1 FL=1